MLKYPSIIALLTLTAGLAHAQIAIPAQAPELDKVIADLGLVQNTLPPQWGHLRTDIKGGNPLQMQAPRRDGLWRPDTVQSLAVPDGHNPVETLIEVELEGVKVTLRLIPRPLQEHDPVVMVQLEDGTLERYFPLPSNLYVGDVDNFMGSSVTAAFRNGKLHADVQLTPTILWRIQPLSDLTTGGDPTLHMVWDAQNVGPSPQGRCGNPDGPAQQPEAQPAGADNDHQHHPHDAVPQVKGINIVTSAQPDGERETGSGGGGGSAQPNDGYGPRANSWDAQLAVDVDCYLYDNYNSVQDTIDFVYQVIGTANARFSSQIGFNHLVTHILVRTSCAGDPYATPNPDSANEMLFRMRDAVWNASNPVPRNIAMLFTGRNLDGATVGLAYQPSACTGADGGQCLIEADFSAFNQARYTIAKHELGHTWDADHTCGSFGTDAYCSVMCPSFDEFSCGTSNTEFMQSSVNQISAFWSTSSCHAHVGNIWYADRLNPYFYPNGNANHPFTAFLDAYNAAPNSGIVELKGYGATNEYIHGPRVYNRPMTIRANGTNGPARIR